MPPQTNNLTPSLTLSQLQENITALQKGGTQNPQVQNYVNNYKNNGDGTYSLNTPLTTPAQPTVASTIFGNDNGNVLEDIAKNTIGSQGIGGLVARPIVSALTVGATSDVANSKSQLAQVNQKLIQKLETMKPTDPQYENIKTTIAQNNQIMGVSNDTLDTLAKNQETQEQNLGIAGNTAATLSMGASGVGAGLTGLAGRSVEGATIGGLGGAGQAAANNESAGSVATQGLIGAGIGATLPFATKLIGALTKGVVGKLSGVETNVLQRAIDNPSAIGDAVKEFATTPEAKQTLVDRAKAAISDFLQNRSEQYGDTLNTLTSKVGFQGKQAVIDSFTNNVAKFGGKIADDGSLSFGDSTLTKGDQANLQSAWDTINNWQNTSVKGSDGLRQAIGNLMDDFKITGNSRANLVLGNVKSDLTDALNKNVSGYSDMLSQYGKQTQLARNLSKELSLSGQAKASTQLNGIMRLFNKDPQVMKQLISVMGKSESDKFLNDLSGAILSDWIPAGRMGNLIKGSSEALGIGAALLAGNPGAAVAAGGAMAATSPRIAGLGARTAGRLANSGINTAVREGTTLLAPHVIDETAQ
jgi:hypothetical protein